MRPRVNSRKHIFQTTLSSALAGVTAGINFVNVVQNANHEQAREVDPGTTIEAVYLEVWVIGAGQQPTTITAIVEKTESGSNAVTTTEMTNLHTYANKKNIFVTHQGIVGDANSNPIPIFREWIKIPKGKQRFGLGDGMHMRIKSITEDTEYCSVIVYKSQS